MSNYGLIGNALIRAGVIDAVGLARAVEMQAQRPGPLGKVIAELGLAAESTVAKTLAATLHLEYLDGDIPTPDAGTAAQIPLEFCKKRSVFPVGLDGNRLRVAVSDPLDY